ncbi:MAG: hypothetical protein U1D55_18950 [Phycisphaerae bacterium]
MARLPTSPPQHESPVLFALRFDRGRASKFGLAVICLVLLAAGVSAQKGAGAPPSGPRVVEAGALTSMPVKELAVFKDGHAFVLHEGEVPTDEHGDVVLDSLPTPVIGTFWPYAADQRAKLKAVITGKCVVKSERTALSIRELLEANVNAEVIINEHDGPRYSGVNLGLPHCEPKSDALAATRAGGAQTPPPAPVEPSPANVVMIKLAEGVKVVPLERIRDVTFLGEPRGKLPAEESRNLMTLKLDWPGAAGAAKSASVGMVYLQKGVRWIPSYRLDIDGEGKARVRLQATILNELTDIHDATAHLVIGVPSFFFKDTIDPIALQESAAQLSQYFQTQNGQRMGYAFSNAIMTQQARMGEYRNTAQPESDALDDVDPAFRDGSRNEDLFIFDVEHLTLRKGERMVVPVTEFELAYTDVFTLDLPFAPPPEVQCNVSAEQAAEIARLLRAPKVMHRIRLKNQSRCPLTTAPAIVLRDGRLLAQSLMTYTAVGGTSDLPVTTAVDVSVERSESEQGREPQAIKWGDNVYGRVNLKGRIRISNNNAKPIALEVRRMVLGTPDSADHDGVAERSSLFDLPDDGPADWRPYWWGWYSWPGWWYHFNGVGKISWTLELKPGDHAELGYQWHYFWR